MKKIIGFLLLCVVAGGVLYMVIPKKTLRNLYFYAKSLNATKKQAEPVLAVFDRNTKDLKVQTDSFQYVNFRLNDTYNQVPDGISTINKTRPVFITVDIYNNFTAENPLESVAGGKYDKKIKELFSHFSKSPNQIFVRMNPEMEVPVNLYSWQGQSPLIYDEAFIRFATICKKVLPNAKIIWSTAGYPGVLEYYPGDDLVDFVSVTLQTASEKATKDFKGYRSIAAEAEAKVQRMRFLNKPVMVLGQPNHNLNPSLKNELALVAQNIHKNKDLFYGTISAEGIKHNSFNKVRTTLNLGVYDPKQELNLLNEISIEHLFPNWGDLKSGSFRKEFNAVIARNHDVIVTMEPWRDTGGISDPDVLANTIKGRYDEQLKELFKILSAVKQTVYLRWTHEMEIPITRYPWQSQPTVDYITAFRHFASFRKPENKNIKLVFGPAGDRGLQDFWPGDDVVDYISMAIYGLPDKNITDHKKQESFQTIYNRKLYRMRFFNKPILISEFGISGPEDFKFEWLMAASKTINGNPQIKAVCYFNMVDSPKAWGDIEAPDWSVSKETFSSFIESLNLGTTHSHLVSNR